MADSAPNPIAIFTLSSASLKLDSEDDIRPHLLALTTSTTITEIRLGGNTLGPAACAYLATILREKSTLHTANLADIFTARLLSEIPPALSSLLTALLPLHRLHTIDLSDNAFGLNTQAPLVDFLAQHTPLQHLVLNNNGLGPRAGVLIADALTALAARKQEALSSAESRHSDNNHSDSDVPDLETVICGRNRLESGSMAAWAATFRAHRRGLRTVKMVQNGIRQEGIALLLREGLGGCAALRMLDLQDNTFTLVGARALAEVAGGWPELAELGVGDCLLGARGGVLVAEALAKGHNAQLRVLRAQYNDIDAGGVKALLKAAKAGLPSLRRLELNGNKFSEDEDSVAALRALLDDRREEHAKTGGRGGGEKQDAAKRDEWGLDDLSDLEEESDDDDDDGDGDQDASNRADDDDGNASEEEEIREAKAERLLRDADLVEETGAVAQRQDKDVDELAERLGKAGI